MKRCISLPTQRKEKIFSGPPEKLVDCFSFLPLFDTLFECLESRNSSNTPRKRTKHTQRVFTQFGEQTHPEFVESGHFRQQGNARKIGIYQFLLFGRRDLLFDRITVGH